MVALQQAVKKLGKETPAAEWSTRCDELQGVLGDKNLMNFMAGVELCGRFVEAALQHQRDFVEPRLPALLSPILKQQALS